eukprot:gene6916-9550_t
MYGIHKGHHKSSYSEDKKKTNKDTTLSKIMGVKSPLMQKKKKETIVVVLASIDTSGSMAGRRIETALEGLGHIVTNILRHGCYFGCFVFNTESRKLHHPLPYAKLNWKKDHFKINQAVGGRTAIYDSIVDGIQECQQFLGEMKCHGKPMREVFDFVFEHIVITDGGDNSSVRSLKSVCDMVARPGFGHYHLCVIGVDLDSTTHSHMASITQPDHCKLMTAKNIDELKKYLNKASDDLVKVVIQYRGEKKEWEGTPNQFNAAFENLNLNAL